MTWWPWSRIRELERERDRADVLLTAMVERSDYAQAEVRRLTDLLLDMKRDGFTAPEAAPEPMKDDTPSVVLDALAERLTPGSREWRQEYEGARKKLEQGQDPEDVAKGILKGNTSFKPAGW